MYRVASALVLVLALAAASPASPILRKLDPLRYQYAQDENTGKLELVDLWRSLDGMMESARYNPTNQNIYHLFTRANPTQSQPLLHGNEAALGASNFDSNKRVIVLIHGWRGDAISDFNRVVVPPFLAAEDVNVIVVDWSAGASSLIYFTALENSIQSGAAVAAFIDWLNEVRFASPVQYHIVGFGLGGHQAAIAARRVTGPVPISYVTGLDPSLLGWVNHPDRFHPDDATYTEVIHTNAGVNGYLSDLAQVDFYPNGGQSMPGCDSNGCDQDRSFFYFAESITSGGFTGRLCASYLTAVLQSCLLPGNLQMGGLRPKIGNAGVYLVFTNEAPPFSQG